MAMLISRMSHAYGGKKPAAAEKAGTGHHTAVQAAHDASKTYGQNVRHVQKQKTSQLYFR